MIEGIVTIALGIVLALVVVTYRQALWAVTWAVFKFVFAIIVFGGLGIVTQFM